MRALRGPGSPDSRDLRGFVGQSWSGRPFRGKTVHRRSTSRWFCSIKAQCGWPTKPRSGCEVAASSLTLGARGCTASLERACRRRARGARRSPARHATLHAVVARPWIRRTLDAQQAQGLSDGEASCALLVARQPLGFARVDAHFMAVGGLNGTLGDRFQVPFRPPAPPHEEVSVCRLELAGHEGLLRGTRHFPPSLDPGAVARSVRCHGVE
jgi:hypothetical protein